MTSSDPLYEQPAKERRFTRAPGGFATKLAGAFVLVLIVLGGTAILAILRLARTLTARHRNANPQRPRHGRSADCCFSQAISAP
jgi:hypothetical protein